MAPVNTKDVSGPLALSSCDAFNDSSEGEVGVQEKSPQEDGPNSRSSVVTTGLRAFLSSRRSGRSMADRVYGAIGNPCCQTGLSGRPDQAAIASIQLTYQVSTTLPGRPC